MKETINIGVIGFGVVGAGAVEILAENATSIQKKVGSTLRVKKIADLDITTPRPVKVGPGVLTTNVDEIINDPEIDIVVETIGGVNPAGSFIRRSLEAGKHVVTANKELLAKEGSSLLPLAADLKRDLSFEASVGGGIPIIRPLKSCLAGNKILQVKGIVNGTTNYILTRMAAEGLSYGDVLPDAQAKGYAEADPTADVEGHDAAYKISILASIAFTSRVDYRKVYSEGITGITSEDMKNAAELGYVIKLLAIAQRIDEAMLVRVHPAFIPKRHPLANVDDVFNGIFVNGSAVGEVMFYGRGAGSMAAGSAIVGDVVDIARNINYGANSRISCTCYDKREMLSMDSVQCKNYIRVLTEDKPKVLASMAAAFGDNNVSIESVIQRILPDSTAEVVWLTHEADEPNTRRALESIRSLPVVKEVSSWIRVEE
ncbi:MAG: homoserine dehydrogenase [Armatimonadetes bacterium]|nr:homoserine dehydrogenase [Armatimonadota bacterium]